MNIPIVDSNVLTMLILDCYELSLGLTDSLLLTLDLPLQKILLRFPKREREREKERKKKTKKEKKKAKKKEEEEGEKEEQGERRRG